MRESREEGKVENIGAESTDRTCRGKVKSEKRRRGNSTDTAFYLVSDDGIEVVNVHGLPAQLAGWLQGG